MPKVVQYAGAYCTVWYPFPLEDVEPQVMAELMVRDNEGREPVTAPGTPQTFLQISPLLYPFGWQSWFCQGNYQGA